MCIVFSDKIEKIVRESEINTADYKIIDAKGRLVAPGLIDMHIHGYLGADASDGDADGIRKMAEGIIKNGVTSWCPTTMTVSKQEIETAFDSVRKVKNSGEYYGSRILGVNSEGPFINESKKGAQAGEHILKPDADFIKKHSDIVKLFTVAPKAGIELDEKLSPAEKLKVVQGLMEQNDLRAAAIYETMGVYFGYTIAYYSMFYDIKHVLIMGRVTSGNGGAIILEKANEVLKTEFPELFAKIQLHIPDEKARRVGQSVAAASLPKIG